VLLHSIAGIVVTAALLAVLIMLPAAARHHNPEAAALAAAVKGTQLSCVTVTMLGVSSLPLQVVVADSAAPAQQVRLQRVPSAVRAVLPRQALPGP